jgi:hypothetical protein
MVVAQIDEVLPRGVSIQEAKDAWMDYCWTRGGGIMVPTFDGSSNFGDDGTVPRQREFLVPYGLKQELVPTTSSSSAGDESDAGNDAVVSYRMVRRGPFFQDIVQGSHVGTVRFTGVGRDTTRMVWTVTFQVPVPEGDGEGEGGQQPETNTTSGVTEYKFGFGLDNKFRYVLSKPAFWKSWTTFQLATATANFRSYLSVPSNLVSINHREVMPLGVTPRQALEGWYRYCWRGEGGGLATLGVPPVLFRNGQQRWIIPALLEEEIVSSDYDAAEVVYRVNNPNLFTYPVHYHQGTVRFSQASPATPTQLLWNVQVRPYRTFLGYGVQFWTKSNMVLSSRNLKLRLEEEEQEQQEKEQQQQQIMQGDPSPKLETRLPLFPNLVPSMEDWKSRFGRHVASSSDTSSPDSTPPS